MKREQESMMLVLSRRYILAHWLVGFIASPEIGMKCTGSGTCAAAQFVQCLNTKTKTPHLISSHLVACTSVSEGGRNGTVSITGGRESNSPQPTYCRYEMELAPFFRSVGIIRRYAITPYHMSRTLHAIPYHTLPSTSFRSSSRNAGLSVRVATTGIMVIAIGTDD